MPGGMGDGAGEGGGGTIRRNLSPRENFPEDLAGEIRADMTAVSKVTP